MKKASFKDLVKTMDRLRNPGGCPWDRKQTHQSLLKYLKEETAEMASAIRKKDWNNLEEEMGDVLLQILFHSKIASEKKRFDIYDVVDTLNTKLKLRHPHVFGASKNEQWSADDVVNKWDEIKKREKAIRQEMLKRRKR